jgi:hypothetical protein
MDGSNIVPLRPQRSPEEVAAKTRYNVQQQVAAAQALQGAEQQQARNRNRAAAENKQGKIAAVNKILETLKAEREKVYNDKKFPDRDTKLRGINDEILRIEKALRMAGPRPTDPFEAMLYNAEKGELNKPIPVELGGPAPAPAPAPLPPTPAAPPAPPALPVRNLRLRPVMPQTPAAPPGGPWLYTDEMVARSSFAADRWLKRLENSTSLQTLFDGALAAQEPEIQYMAEKIQFGLTTPVSERDKNAYNTFFNELMLYAIHQFIREIRRPILDKLYEYLKTGSIVLSGPPPPAPAPVQRGIFQRLFSSAPAPAPVPAPNRGREVRNADRIAANALTGPLRDAWISLDNRFPGLNKKILARCVTYAFVGKLVQILFLDPAAKTAFLDKLKKSPSCSSVIYKLVCHMLIPHLSGLAEINTIMDIATSTDTEIRSFYKVGSYFNPRQSAGTLFTGLPRFKRPQAGGRRTRKHKTRARVSRKNKTRR